MRKHAAVRRPGLLISSDPDVPLRRVMLHDADGGVFCYLYDRPEDCSCWNDYFFDSFPDAESYCAEEFGVTESDWRIIPDPLSGCQHDWIEPVRQSPGGLEALRDSQWVLIQRPCESGVEVLRDGEWVLTHRWSKHGQPETFRDGTWVRC